MIVNLFILQTLEIKAQVSGHHVHDYLPGTKNADCRHFPGDSPLLLCHHWP